MGEAARHVAPEVRARHPDVEWEEMIANRNVMIHVYFGLKAEIVWDTIQKDFPPLRERLIRVLADPDAPLA